MQGVNASEMEVVLREGRPKAELLAEMRRSVALVPGAAVTFGQPISHRIDHMISGSKTNLAVKIFGPDLAVLRGLAADAERRLRDVPGIVDLSNQEQQSVPQLLFDFDREAMARLDLSPAALARGVEALFQGTEAGEIVEGGLASRVVVRFPERLRRDRERLVDLPVTVREGRVVRLGEVARVRFDLGPGLVRRENVQRLAMLTANVEGADLVGAVERARAALAGLALPPGYQVTFGGQFEEAARSQQSLGLLSILALAGMYGLLLLAFRDRRHVAIVLVNLPLALIGGVAAVALHGGVLSVASIVGFVTLFGIATRNGVLLVSHYEHLLRDEGANLREAVVRGSSERLAPVLMTALTAGLALVPLVLAGDHPGNEIQSPMAEVILGGLLTSTFLNLVVVPVLFDRWGGPARAQAATAEWRTLERSRPIEAGSEPLAHRPKGRGRGLGRLGRVVPRVSLGLLRTRRHPAGRSGLPVALHRFAASAQAARKQRLRRAPGSPVRSPAGRSGRRLRRQSTSPRAPGRGVVPRTRRCPTGRIRRDRRARSAPAPSTRSTYVSGETLRAGRRPPGRARLPGSRASTRCLVFSRTPR